MMNCKFCHANIGVTDSYINPANSNDYFCGATCYDCYLEFIGNKDNKEKPMKCADCGTTCLGGIFVAIGGNHFCHPGCMLNFQTKLKKEKPVEDFNCACCSKTANGIDIFWNSKFSGKKFCSRACAVDYVEKEKPMLSKEEKIWMLERVMSSQRNLSAVDFYIHSFTSVGDCDFSIRGALDDIHVLINSMLDSFIPDDGVENV